MALVRLRTRHTEPSSQTSNLQLDTELRGLEGHLIGRRGLRRGNLHGLCRHRIGHLRLHGADVAVPDLGEGGHANDRRPDGLQFGDRPLLENDHD